MQIDLKDIKARGVILILIGIATVVLPGYLWVFVYERELFLSLDFFRLTVISLFVTLPYFTITFIFVALGSLSEFFDELIEGKGNSYVINFILSGFAQVFVICPSIATGYFTEVSTKEAIDELFFNMLYGLLGLLGAYVLRAIFKYIKKKVRSL